MKKILFTLIVSIFVVSCSGNTEVAKNNNVTEVSNTKVQEENNELLNEEIKQYSQADVSSHNTKEDCYTIIDGRVYDISTFFGQHGGGDDNILKLCGIDGSELFNNKHGSDQKAVITKNFFYIGNYKN